MLMNIETALKDAMTIEGALGVTLVDYESGMSLGSLGGGRDLDLEIASAGNTEVVRAKVLESTYGGDKGYMVVSAKNELRKKGYTDQEIALGGLSITTTFKKPLMEAAKETIQA